MNKHSVLEQLEALELQVKELQQHLDLINVCRNETLEEVAVAIERMQCFGQDTVSSFTVYIRGMKK
jgi:hypothetical protein